MDTISQGTPGTKLTLDMICQQKAEKLAEIRASKKRIANHTREIFNPTESTDGTNALINHFGSSMTILNGVITGFRIIKRIRNFFRRKY